MIFLPFLSFLYQALQRHQQFVEHTEGIIVDAVFAVNLKRLEVRTDKGPSRPTGKVRLTYDPLTL